MQGIGVITYADGRRFEGRFNQNKKYGPGMFVLPNKNRYEGEIKHGSAMITLNGRAYEIDWLGGREEGTPFWNILFPVSTRFQTSNRTDTLMKAFCSRLTEIDIDADDIIRSRQEYDQLLNQLGDMFYLGGNVFDIQLTINGLAAFCVRLIACVPPLWQLVHWYRHRRDIQLSMLGNAASTFCFLVLLIVVADLLWTSASFDVLTDCRSLVRKHFEKEAIRIYMLKFDQNKETAVKRLFVDRVDKDIQMYMQLNGHELFPLLSPMQLCQFFAPLSVMPLISYAYSMTRRCCMKH
jgi:hypothetical protein